MKKIKKEMEEVREQLYAMINSHKELTVKEIVKVSQKLDHIIKAYYC